jgi:hypothetical protein
MKGSKLAFLALLFGSLMLVNLGRASAQPGTVAPSQQFGIGVFSGGNLLGGGILAGYAISPGIHVGLQLSARGTADTSTATTLRTLEALYLRGLLEGTVNPFFQVRLGLSQESATATNAANQSVTVSSSRTEIALDFGLEYFATRNIGVDAFINVVDLALSPNETVYGINNGGVGVEWWFNR